MSKYILAQTLEFGFVKNNHKRFILFINAAHDRSTLIQNDVSFHIMGEFDMKYCTYRNLSHRKKVQLSSSTTHNNGNKSYLKFKTDLTGIIN